MHGNVIGGSFTSMHVRILDPRVRALLSSVTHLYSGVELVERAVGEWEPENVCPPMKYTEASSQPIATPRCDVVEGSYVSRKPGPIKTSTSTSTSLSFAFYERLLCSCLLWASVYWIKGYHLQHLCHLCLLNSWEIKTSAG